MGRSATPRRRVPLPSLEEDTQSGQRRQDPAARQAPTGLEEACTHSSRLPLAAPPPAPASGGQRGLKVEEVPAAAERKRRPGGCCYPTPPTPSACNALGPASARLLPAGAGLVRAAVCRCGSSPSPRCPPPPPPLRVPRRPPNSAPRPPPPPRPESRAGFPLRCWSRQPAVRGTDLRAQSNRAGARAWESGRRGCTRLGLRRRLPDSAPGPGSRKELVVKFWAGTPPGRPLRLSLLSQSQRELPLREPRMYRRPGELRKRGAQRVCNAL